MCSRSNYQHEPAEEQVEEDDRIQGQFSLTLGNHLSQKGYRTSFKKIDTQSCPQETGNYDCEFEDWRQPAFDEYHGKRGHIDGEQTVAEQTGGLEEGPSYDFAYIVEPRKFALRYTTTDPTHIITKIDVMIVLESDSVRKDSVAESSRHNASGPQRSPS